MRFKMTRAWKSTNVFQQAWCYGVNPSGGDVIGLGGSVACMALAYDIPMCYEIPNIVRIEDIKNELI